jgi:hypothetical protein
VTEYRGTFGTITLGVPRDVAIQPFVSILVPGFGDRADATSALFFSWRDEVVGRYRITFSDLGPKDSLFPQPVALPALEDAFNQGERFSRTFHKDLAELTKLNPLIGGHRYRIVVEVLTGASATFSSVTTEFVYQE